MRRPWLVGPLFLVLCTTVASGDAPNVANTSQKGSVHVFPYVVADANRTTFIRLANEGPGDIDVHCEFKDDNDVHGGFVTQIKKRQAVWIDVTHGGVATYHMKLARYPQQEGGPFNDGGRKSVGEGELVCWAVNEGDSWQVRWNHIFASATIVDYTNGTMFEYPSWAFQARQGLDKQPVGLTAGKIELDGVYYDACPRFLHGVSGDNPDSPPGGGGDSFTTDPVIITPCVFDVRQDRVPFATYLSVTTWNALGTSSSTSSTCGDYWNRVLLPDATGQFRISAVANAACPDSRGAGLVGVHYRPGGTAGGGTGLAGSDIRTNGVIRWDPQPSPEE